MSTKTPAPPIDRHKVVFRLCRTEFPFCQSATGFKVADHIHRVRLLRRGLAGCVSSMTVMCVTQKQSITKDGSPIAGRDGELKRLLKLTCIACVSLSLWS